MAVQPTTFLAAFEFGSLSMLVWLAAAALPWLIHRWKRRPHRTTTWAAVELLLVAMRERSRRVRFQQWLLIALRTAILALVALAAAEPALRQGTLVSGRNAPTHLVLVIDQSYSMSCRQQDVSRLQRAKAHARRLVEGCDSGDAISVIGWSQAADNVLGRPTTDVSLALSAIDGLLQTHANADLLGAVRAVLAALDRAENEVPHLTEHQVVFISDLGRNTWKEASADRTALAELTARASLAVADAGDDHRDNVAIANLSVDPAIVLRQREVVLAATLRGFGERDWAGIMIELLVDGRQVQSQRVDLSANGEATVRFPYRFVDQGQHTVQVSIASDSIGDADGLPLDNHRWLVVDVRPQLRVACFAGKPGAADDVARALAPASAEADQTVRPEVLSISRLSELDLSDYDAALLCNAADLNPREAAHVARYVYHGGALAILLGEQTSAERLHRLGPEKDFGDLLPVEIGPPAEVGNYRFDPLDYRHPIVSPFRGRESSGLLSVAVAQYVGLRVKAEHLSAETALAFDTGDPALVVDRYGLGRVAVLAIPGSLAARTAEGRPWSTFPVSPSFLPIVRELVTYLVGDRRLEERNLLVGQPAVSPWNVSRRATEIDVRLPDGSSRGLPSPGAEDQGQVVLADTATSGIYTLSAAEEPIARFAVNLDTRESDLTTVDSADLPDALTARSADSSEPFRLATTNFSFASSLLVAVAILLLLEPAIAGWLGRRWQ